MHFLQRVVKVMSTFAVCTLVMVGCSRQDDHARTDVPLVKKPLQSMLIGQESKMNLQYLGADQTQKSFSLKVKVTKVEELVNEKYTPEAVFVYFNLSNEGKGELGLLLPRRCFLRDDQGRIYTGKHPDMMQFMDPALVHGLGPGMHQDLKVAFKLPRDSQGKSLEFWIGSEDDKNNSMISLKLPNKTEQESRMLEDNENLVGMSLSKIDASQ
jgi:hypothetical protein